MKKVKFIIETLVRGKLVADDTTKQELIASFEAKSFKEIGDKLSEPNNYVNFNSSFSGKIVEIDSIQYYAVYFGVRKNSVRASFKLVALVGGGDLQKPIYLQ